MNGLTRLQAFLRSNAYDGVLLLSPTNLNYFAGFSGTTAVAFVTPVQAYMFTDSRYTEQAKEQCEGYTVIQYGTTVWDSLRQVVDEEGISLKTCVFEGDYVPVDTYTAIAGKLDGTSFASAKLATLRAVKREDELGLMRRAAEIADEAFAVLLTQLRPGMTENEARIILEKEMLVRGSSEPSFATIVASGKRSCMPHGVASDKVIEEGDFVTFDFGAVYKGYHSDITRTIVMGKASDLQKKLYDVVLTAQRKGVAAVKPGLTGKALDAVCRDSIAEAGYGSYFEHGTGHGVGLDIHEQPVASPRSDSVLEPGMVVTIEPGVYIPGEIGLRIEDSVIVTNEGCEILTKTPKELIELDV
ncbi:Xaa-Pro peptidase family protein [uncultured Veillonella sp.]|uniref:M24 family metallopeptidase n=1 Tax=uncultured Veillonella sp. TaxID=159268 RepID=UPI0025997B67|nr:Xaa-Pro peptidase family protein [uncultured Veillonella sp.]